MNNKNQSDLDMSAGQTNAASPGVDSGRTAGTRSMDQSQVQSDANATDNQDINHRNQEVEQDSNNRTGAGETSTSSDQESDDQV